MAKPQLLTDSFLVKFSLSEDKTRSGILVASGPFGKAGVPTANKRIYPVEVWEREIQRLADDMQTRKVFGELDHPGDGKTKLSRVSHLVTEATLDDDGVIIGKAEILETNNGKTLKTILDAGGKVGVSSRGYGSVKTNGDGYDVVQDDFQFVTFDFVADPAASNSYPEFRYEGKKKEEPAVMEVKPETTTESVEATTPPPGTQELREADAKVEAAPAIVEEPKAPTMNDGQLKKEFSAQLSERIKGLEAKVREEVKAELMATLMADPTVAGAKATLESVKVALRPYIIGEDVDAEIGNRDKKIAGLEEKVRGLESELSLRSAKLEEFEGVTKELGYKLFLERFIASHPKRTEIVEKLGDVTRFDSVEALKANTEKALEEYKWVEDEKRVIESAHREEVSKLEEELKSLKGSLDEALQMSRDFGIRAYLEKKISGHPRGEHVRELARNMHLVTKEDVDSLVESVTPVEKTKGDFKSRIRRFVSENVVEDQISETLPRRSGYAPITEVTGQSLADIERLSGLKIKH